jgi:hypothetical protein
MRQAELIWAFGHPLLVGKIAHAIGVRWIATSGVAQQFMIPAIGR